MKPARDRTVTSAVAREGVGCEGEGIAAAFDHGSGGSEPSGFISGSDGVFLITVTL
jgi:hypothetical protein